MKRRRKPACTHPKARRVSVWTGDPNWSGSYNVVDWCSVCGALSYWHDDNTKRWRRPAAAPECTEP